MASITSLPPVGTLSADVTAILPPLQDAEPVRDRPASPAPPSRRSRRAFVEGALYGLLFVLAATSAALFAGRLLWGDAPWDRFIGIYATVLVVYTLYLYLLLLVHEVRPRRFPRYAGERIAVIVPVFNEEPELLERALVSVVEARGVKTVILVDDGSTNGIGGRLAELAAELGCVHAALPCNQGKREALHHAVTRLLPEDTAFVVTIDSDTVLDEWALVRVVEPLCDSRVGAATGDVRLLNERQNLLTRMIGTYYWIGLNIYKQAQSAISSVVCCSGCLAAYRADLLRAIITPFHEQVFLGERCTHSEDRHLTNLVLQRGYDVVYAPEAISWTETPASVRGFLRQQRRWKRGYIRESIYTLTYAWRVKRLLWLQVAFWDLTAPFLSFGLRLGLIGLALTQPHTLLTVVIPSWLLMLLVRYILVPLRAPRKLPGLLLYMLFYETTLYWLNLWALLTVRNSSWVTRQHRPAHEPATVI